MFRYKGNIRMCLTKKQKYIILQDNQAYNIGQWKVLHGIENFCHKWSVMHCLVNGMCMLIVLNVHSTVCLNNVHAIDREFIMRGT